MRTETIEWHDPAEVMPSSWVTVLVHTKGIPDGDKMHKDRVGLAYVFPMSFVDDDEEQWQWNVADSDGGRLYETVIEWAHMPKGSS